MSTSSRDRSEQSERSPRVSARTVVALLVTAALVVWILTNRTPVDVTFWVLTATVPLWTALTIAAVLGCVAGFLLGRQHYRRR